MAFHHQVTPPAWTLGGCMNPARLPPYSFRPWPPQETGSLANRERPRDSFTKEALLRNVWPVRISIRLIWRF